MKEAIKERIKDVLAYTSDTVNSASSKIGIPQKTLNRQINEDTDVSTRTIIAICDYYKEISPEWILTGDGEMVKSKNQAKQNNVNSVEYKFVPLLSLDAVGGMHRKNLMLNEEEYTEKLIPFTDAMEGDIALQVSGESMSPTCPAGSKVLIREVPHSKTQ